MMENKMKKTERTIIDKCKEEEDEREARITNLVAEWIGRTKTGKKQQEEEEGKEETKKEVKKLKRLMKDRERRKRKNYLPITRESSNQRIKRKREKEPDRECTEIFRRRSRG